MRPRAVVVLLVGTQNMTQMPLANYDHVIEAFSSDRADQSFRIAVLPRRSQRCRSVANAPSGKCLSVDAVPITNQIGRHCLPAAGFGDLASDPFCSGMRGDAKPHNSPPAVSENEQSV